MQYKNIALESDFTFTNTSTSNERLFLFQLKDEDILKMNQLFDSNPHKDEFISKENKIINSLLSLSDIQKSEYLKIILDYMDSLHELKFNNAYYFSRKNISYTLNKLNIDKSIFDSTLSRIKENYLFYVFSENTSDKEILFDSTITITNFFDFESDVVQKFYEEGNINIQLSGILKSLEDITNIDFIPTTENKLDLIHKGLTNFKTTINDITKTSKLNANRIETITNASNNLSKVISDDKSNIEMAIEEIFSINNDFRKTEATINDLVMNIRTINSIISAIKSISEQTTLLAINASIEASRAEAEGKGFSVIAEEIRNLSEQTTSSVERITNIIQKFEENTFRLEKNTKDVVARLNQKTKNTELALTNLNEIFETSEDILKSIFNISKDFVSIDDKASNLQNSIDIIIEDSNDVSVNIRNLGSEVYNSAEHLIKSKESIERNIKQLNYAEILKLFTLNAKRVYWELYNYRIKINKNDVLIKEYDNYFTNYFILLSRNDALSESEALNKFRNTHNDIIKSAEKTFFFIDKNELEEADKGLKKLKSLVNEFSVTGEILLNTL